jgi:hypothetical protein
VFHVVIVINDYYLAKMYSSVGLYCGETALSVRYVLNLPIKYVNELKLQRDTLLVNAVILARTTESNSTNAEHKFQNMNDLCVTEMR